MQLSDFSIVIWETLVKSGGEAWRAFRVVRVSGWSWGKFEWLSLHHHGNCDVVVVRWVLNFSSVLLSDGLEGVISYDLSECLEGNAVNNIKGIGW